MTFPDALKAAFVENDRITRTSWNNRDICAYVADAKLCIRGGIDLATGATRTDGMPYPFTISESDYFAEDWEVVTDA